MITVRPTHATRTRNLVAPHADKLVCGLTFSEGSGTAITNIVTHLNLTDLGATTATSASCGISSATGGFTARMVGKYLRVTAGTNWTAGAYRITAVASTNAMTVAGPVGSSATLNAGTGSGKIHETGRRDDQLLTATIGGSGAGWTGETLAVTTSTTLSMAANDTGENLIFYRGTVGMVRTFSDLSSARTLWRNGVGSGTNGHRGISVSTTGVTFSSRAAGVTTTVAVAATIANNDVVAVWLSWDKETLTRTLTVSINGATPVSSSQSWGSTTLIVNDGNALTFNNDSGAMDAGTILGFYWWDWRLPTTDLDEYVVDPHLASRPLLSANLTAHRVAPICGRPVWSGGNFICSFQLAGAEDMTVGGTPEKLQIRFYTDAYCTTILDPGMTIEHTFSAADEGQPIILTMGDVHAMGSRLYWKAFISVDGGTTYRPGPARRGVLYTGDDGKIILVSDCHAGVNEWAEPVSGYDAGMPATFTSSPEIDNLARYAQSCEALRRYCLANDVSAIIHLGDGPWNRSVDTVPVAWEMVIVPGLSLCAPVGFIPGNHEELFLNKESVTSTEYDAGESRRRENVVRWKLQTLNPSPDQYDEITDTIDWAENQGTPVAPVNDSAEWKPYHDAFGGKAVGAATYAAGYIQTGTGGTWAENLGLNNSPLGNFWAMPLPTRKLLLVGLDVITYAYTRSSELRATALDQPWGGLGPHQWAWLESIGAWADAAGYEISLFVHNALNGILFGDDGEEQYYRRGMFLNGDHAEDARLIAFCRAHRVRVVAHGHDHGFAIGRRDGIAQICVPTFGFHQQFTQVVGPEMSSYDNVLDYGSASVQGADAPDITAMWAHPGFVILDTASWTAAMRQTCVGSYNPRHLATLDSNTLRKWVGRYVGPETEVGQDGAIALEDVPTCVYMICTPGDGDFEALGDSTPVYDHAQFAALNLYAHSDQAWYAEDDACIAVLDIEQPFATAEVVPADTLAASDPCRVHYVPRTLGTYAVQKAISASGGSGNISPMGVAG